MAVGGVPRYTPATGFSCPGASMIMKAVMTEDEHLALRQRLGFKVMFHASAAVAGVVDDPVPLSQALETTVARLADGLIANGVETSFVDGWKQAYLDTERVAACDMIVAEAITLAHALGRNGEAISDTSPDGEALHDDDTPLDATFMAGMAPSRRG